MKKRVCLIGSILLGATMVTMGLFNNLALAQQSVQTLKSRPGPISPPNRCKARPCAVPEPSSLIFLGTSLAGLGIWSWRRKSK